MFQVYKKGDKSVIENYRGFTYVCRSQNILDHCASSFNAVSAVRFVRSTFYCNIFIRFCIYLYALL